MKVKTSICVWSHEWVGELESVFYNMCKSIEELLKNCIKDLIKF